MVYCDTHGCGGNCPYWNKCNEFELVHSTLPCGFLTEDEKPPDESLKIKTKHAEKACRGITLKFNNVRR